MKAARKKVAKKAAKKAAVKKPAKKAAPPRPRRRWRSRQPKSATKTAAKPAPKKPAAKTTSPSSNGGPITWNFKLLAHHGLDGFGGMGEGMSIQIAPDGRRILWLAHESAPKNFTAVDVSDPRSPRWWCRPTCRRPTCARTRWRPSATSWRSPTRPREGPEAGGVRAVRHLGSGEAEIDLLLRLLGTRLARRAPALVLRRRIRAHGGGRGRLQADHPNDDQFYRGFDVRNPSKPVEVGRWWMPGTSKADNAVPPPRHPLLTGASAPTIATSIRSGRTVAISPISTAGCSCSTFRTRPTRSAFRNGQLAALYRLHAHGGAAVRPRPHAGDRRVHGEQRQGLAQADLDARRPRGDQSRADLDLPAARPPGLRRQGRFGAHNIHENVPLPTAWQSDQIVLGTFFNGGLRAYDIANPYQPQQIGVFVPPAPPMAPTAPSSSTTCSSTSARSSTPSTATSAGSISWRWIFDHHPEGGPQRMIMLHGSHFGVSDAAHSVRSPPPCGEGLRVGVAMWGNSAAPRTTPLPSPPPQGGRERTEFVAC